MKYDKHQIAKELRATASNEAYYGNALYVAMDIPAVTKEDRMVIKRYLRGSGAISATDHIRLHEIAMRIVA
jgi:hypothetical protein